MNQPALRPPRCGPGERGVAKTERDPARSRRLWRAPGLALCFLLLLPPALHAAPERPQMTAADAARHRVADYLAQGPEPWQPLALNVRTWQPDAVVAADGSGTHRSVQAAVDAAPAAAANVARRWLIQIKPGVYRGPLCVQGKGPLALYGVAGDAGAVTLVDGRYNGLVKRAGVDAAQPCQPRLAEATHGTSGSASVVLASADTVVAHLSIVNDASPPPGSEGAQAVALLTLADRIQLEDVRLLGHQDTFYVRRPAPGSAARVFVRGSVIAGDVDFVFGNATLVIDDSTLWSRAGREQAGGAVSGGHVLAPSTPAGVALGFLVQRSRFVADAGVAEGAVSLGRAWDEGVAPGTWVAGQSPNGQARMQGSAWPNGEALVRDSALGPHIAAWAASTSRRPYTSAGAAANRLAEHGNTVLPRDIAREGLASDDGWGAAEGGTRGGADAAPADVHVVHNRAELAAALLPHPRPRIVKLAASIDLSVDDAGRPLLADDYRDPAFDWAAYAAAYDPATWGKRNPQGPLEDARARSARAQAARVVLRVPSRTTLIGVGPGAKIVKGGLMLEKVSDIIVRNLHFSDAYDDFPAWDPNDNSQGEWNSEYDNLSLRGATRVWVDHCTFDDGAHPDADEPTLLGRRMQRHDGLLDITQQSSHVTVSWNHFRRHDKTSLVGSSDSQLRDEDRLKVTFHHNLWEQTKERSPRVRWGQVHAYNNLHLVHDEASFGYSLGVGFRSALYSQANAWETPPTLATRRLVRLYRGSAFEDHDSIHNGRPVDLLAELRAANPNARIEGSVGWVPVPSRAAPLDPATEVAPRVRAGAGVGRLWVGVD